VVPIVALVVAAWMIVRQFHNRGPEIAIEFASASGIEAGKTPLQHKGVTIGTVKDVLLNPNLSGVVVVVRLTKSGAAVAHAGSIFWVVHPQVSLSGISGLETLVTGVRLRVRPGSGAPTTRFRGLDTPPSIDDPNKGRAFTLRAQKLDGINPGAPVYYRGVKVGIVETTKLADDATAAVVRVRIYTEYVDLVRTNTQFWDVSGFDFKLGLSGAELHTATLPSILSGGVAFATPGGSPLAPSALENTEYILHPQPQKEWLTWEPQIPIHPIESTPETARADSLGDSNGPANDRK
jgi:paraquat-inducible protein B